MLLDFNLKWRNKSLSYIPIKYIQKKIAKSYSIYIHFLFKKSRLHVITIAFILTTNAAALQTAPFVRLKLRLCSFNSFKLMEALNGEWFREKYLVQERSVMCITITSRYGVLKFMKCSYIFLSYNIILTLYERYNQYFHVFSTKIFWNVIKFLIT